MTAVNILEAKTHLSKLVDAVESGAEREIVIARRGKPVARLVPIEEPARKQRKAGYAKGLFAIPEDWDAMDAQIERMFNGDDD